VRKANFVTADLLVKETTKGTENSFFGGLHLGWGKGNIFFKCCALVGCTKQPNHHVVFIHIKQ
jgi:hypothetical protein